MHSEDWEIIPTTYTETIDGREIKMFGYKLNHVEADGITSLIINNIPCRYYSELQEGLLDFFIQEIHSLATSLAKEITTPFTPAVPSVSHAINMNLIWWESYTSTTLQEEGSFSRL